MFEHLRFSRAAKADLLHIRLESARMFGREQAIAYSALLRRALEDIDSEPMRPESQARPELGDGFRSYRVELSRRHSGTGVKRSRHVVVYIELPNGLFGVSRILHDSMVPLRHIPVLHRQGPIAFGLDEEE